jgi:hypothetical protein
MTTITETAVRPLRPWVPGWYGTARLRLEVFDELESVPRGVLASRLLMRFEGRGKPLQLPLKSEASTSIASSSRDCSAISTCPADSGRPLGRVVC